MVAYGHFVRGELIRAESWARTAVDAARAQGSTTEGLAERVLGNVEFFRGHREEALDWMERLEVKAQSAEQSIGELSGGNQQKVAFGRLLYHQARLLLLDEPTRGIDVGSKASIYRRIGRAAEQGRTVVLVSSYIPELLGVCDTVAVCCRGEIVAVKPVSEWTEQDLVSAAIGQGTESGLEGKES
jgi:ABC-type sugar transport system ATPase subunit